MTEGGMKHLNGYLAAPFTPMLANGDLNLDLIPDYAAFLRGNALDGAFVCGSTGEGALLTREERMQVAEAWMKAGGHALKIVVHTGGTTLKDQQALASHAEQIGARGVAAMAPAFLSPTRNEELLALCRTVAAAAPALPFYYYHIPSLNGVNLPVPALMESATGEIPNFAGVKYTSDQMSEFEACRQVAGGRYEVFLGTDALFLDALYLGNRSGVGGTYNHCFTLYRQMLEAFDRNDPDRCRELQEQSHRFLRIVDRYRGNLVGGKRIMKFLGLDCGPSRLPLQNLSDQEEKALRSELDEIGFFGFCNRKP